MNTISSTLFRLTPQAIARLALGISLIAMLGLFAACAPGSPTGSDSGQPAAARWLASFAESGVRVEIGVGHDAASQPVLMAAYTPLERGYHLYSKDLPAHGIDGAGRPTLLALSSEHLSLRGEIYTSAEPVDLYVEGFAEPFPVYPPGPVTLWIELAPAESMPAEAAAVVYVSYMACSDSGNCLLPVTEYPIEVVLTASSLLPDPR